MQYTSPAIDMHYHGHHASDGLLCNGLSPFTIKDTDPLAGPNALASVAENRPVPSAGRDRAHLGAIGTHRPVQGALTFEEMPFVMEIGTLMAELAGELAKTKTKHFSDADNDSDDIGNDSDLGNWDEIEHNEVEEE